MSHFPLCYCLSSSPFLHMKSNSVSDSLGLYYLTVPNVSLLPSSPSQQPPPNSPPSNIHQLQQNLISFLQRSSSNHFSSQANGFISSHPINHPTANSTMPYYGDHHYGGQHYGGHHSDDRPRRHAERVPEYQKDYEKTMHHADWQKTIDLDSAQQVSHQSPPSPMLTLLAILSPPRASFSPSYIPLTLTTSGFPEKPRGRTA